MFLRTKKEDTSYICRINATNEKAAKSCSQLGFSTPTLVIGITNETSRTVDFSKTENVVGLVHLNIERTEEESRGMSTHQGCRECHCCTWQSQTHYDLRVRRNQ